MFYISTYAAVWCTIFKNNILHGSVTTPLRCCGKVNQIFVDTFLFSLLIKKTKISHILAKMWKITHGIVFNGKLCTIFQLFLLVYQTATKSTRFKPCIRTKKKITHFEVYCNFLLFQLKCCFRLFLRRVQNDRNIYQL